MIGRRIDIAAVIVLTASTLLADRPSPSAPTATNRDILYFYRDYPIFIRIRIEVDGVSFEDAWREYLRSLFAEVDSNADGRLTEDEIADRSNSNDEGHSLGVLQLVRDPDLWSADRAPLDQAITMDELRVFLIRRQRGPFQAPDRAPAPVVNSGTAGATLFELLDRNTDRTLSADEFAAAMTSLHRRDLDDDGTFGIAELTPTSSPFARPAAPAETADSRPFVTLVPGSASLAVLREIERRYAPAPSVTPGSRSTLARDLSAANLGLEDEAFRRHDIDANGTFDRDELRELVRSPTPTLELIVRLGKRDAEAPAVDLIGVAKGQDISMRRSAGGLTSLVIHDVQIEIAEARDGPDVAKQYMLRQFAAADRDNNNYVERKEAGRNNAFRASFDQFDRDGDGKLFEEELTAVVDGRTKAARSRTRMNVRNRGRDLFEILDVDRNRRLGRRELSRAAGRIELWDADGDGAVGESDIPQLYQISFGPGQPEFRGVQIPGQAARSTEDDNSTNPVAPKWFTRLDRNGDGELARREFPGTRAEFRKLDQNADGVVDAAEAEFVK